MSLFGAANADRAEPVADVRRTRAAASPEFADRIGAHLLPLLEAADRCADRFGTKHRSGFINNFILAALAVVFAASAIVVEGISHSLVPWLIAAEVAVIGLVIFNTWLGNRQAWHANWLQARHLAEWTRVLAFALPLGDPLLRLDSSDSASDDWIRWRVRAAARAVGVPGGRMNRARLAAMRDALLGTIADQKAYHRRNVRRMKVMDHRTHRTGLVIFIIGILVALAHGAHALSHGEGVPAAHGIEKFLADLLTTLSVALPALGSAIYGIRLQGDFAELCNRSQRMVNQLQELEETLRKDPLRHALLANRIRQLAQFMLRDTQDWRLAFESRPLALPS